MMSPFSFYRKLRSKSPAELRRLFHQYYKDVKFGLLPESRRDKTIALITGCQRSGSTMLYEIFSHDATTKVFGEFSRLNRERNTRSIRLKPIPQLKSALKSIPQPLVVIKPLVESQNVTELLQLGDRTKVIWLYRDYDDVAASHYKKWGAANGLNNLRPILRGDERNWRAQKVPAKIARRVKALFSETMPSEEASALFWWVRNTHFFQQKLEGNPNVYLCRYRNLVSEPALEMRKIYAFLDVEYPGDRIVRHVHRNSVGKGKKATISKEVRQLCDQLFQDLRAVSEK